MITDFKQYKIYETENLLKLEVENIDNQFVNELIDKLSFVYKKRKDKYVRPISITGISDGGNIKLDILLSNKDNIHLRYKNNDELIIKVNDNVLYHMDEIKYNDVISKTYKIYSTHLKDNKYKITKKDNPFECLTEDMLNILK